VKILLWLALSYITTPENILIKKTVLIAEMYHISNKAVFSQKFAYHQKCFLQIKFEYCHLNSHISNKYKKILITVVNCNWDTNMLLRKFHKSRKLQEIQMMCTAGVTKTQG